MRGDGPAGPVRGGGRRQGRGVAGREEARRGVALPARVVLPAAVPIYVIVARVVPSPGVRSSARRLREARRADRLVEVSMSGAARRATCRSTRRATQTGGGPVADVGLRSRHQKSRGSAPGERAIALDERAPDRKSNRPACLYIALAAADPPSRPRSRSGNLTVSWQVSAPVRRRDASALRITDPHGRKMLCGGTASMSLPARSVRRYPRQRPGVSGSRAGVAGGRPHLIAFDSRHRGASR